MRAKRREKTPVAAALTQSARAIRGNPAVRTVLSTQKPWQVPLLRQNLQTRTVQALSPEQAQVPSPPTTHIQESAPTRFRVLSKSRQAIKNL